MRPLFKPLKLLARLLFAMAGIWSANTLAQVCSEIFPGPVQNSDPAGSITFQWGAVANGASGNIIDTVNLNDNAGPNTSCGGASCIASGSAVPAGNTPPIAGGNLPSISVPSSGSTTISPGSYRNITVNSSGTLYVQPGIYTLSRDFNLYYDARVVITQPGTVTFFVRRDINVNSSVQVNTSGSDRYLFLFSDRDVFVYSSSQVNAVIYADRNLEIHNAAVVNGAVTSVGNMTLNSGATVNYDATAVANADYDTFCTTVSTPNLVAEWRLDELSWTGNGNEVLDSSGNGRHGRAINLDSLPTTERSNPVVSGNPGTCRYGDFGGSTDGYVQIDDPGSNSVLDLPEYSVTVWINPRAWASSGLETIVSKDENFEFHLNGSGQVNWWWGGGERELTTAAGIPLNEWHHIAITYESGNQVIYVDGVVAATGTSTAAVTLNDDPVFIGVDLAFPARRFDGLIDEVRIYDGPLTQAEVVTIRDATHPCIWEPTLDHFVIDVGSGTASTCSPTTIFISARDSNDAVVSDYTGTISLSTSTGHGTWGLTGSAGDATGILTAGGADSGLGSYEFEASGGDQGEIYLNLANNHAETLTIRVEDSSAGAVATSAPLTFSENVFVISANDSLGDDLIAGRRHQYQVEMRRYDSTTGCCGPAVDYDVSPVTDNIKLWLSRMGGDPGGTAPQATNNAGNDTEALPDTAPATNNFRLAFTDGVANFSLLASDVGQYSLIIADDSLVYSDSAIIGGSTTLTARPFAFDIKVVGNPGGSSTSGPAFVIAGEDFSATVRAVAWSSADDLNDDGVADGHDDADPDNNANLADNAALGAFGQESTTVDVLLTAQLVQPTGGNDPGLGTSVTSPDGREIGTFSGGTGSTSTLYYDEVGFAELHAQLNQSSYLSAGSVFSGRIVGRSGSVGRFVADHLVLTGAALTPACNIGGFTYLGEAFQLGYTLEARNTHNIRTQNYTGAFVRWDPDNGLGSVGYVAVDQSAPVTNLSARLSSVTTAVWSAGSGTVISDVTLARAATPRDGPFTVTDLGALPEDADNASLEATALDMDADADTTDDHQRLDQSRFFTGRVRLADAFGPETAALPVIFATEYWDGSLWRENVLDSCTRIPLSAIQYPGGTADVAGNRSVALGAGSTTGSYNLAGGDVQFNGGSAGHSFSAPGAGNTGSFQVQVNLGTLPWLQFDWNSDGSFTETGLPAASYSFGSYRGHDRVIYWQEVLR